MATTTASNTSNRNGSKIPSTNGLPTLCTDDVERSTPSATASLPGAAADHTNGSMADSPLSEHSDTKMIKLRSMDTGPLAAREEAAAQAERTSGATADAARSRNATGWQLPMSTQGMVPLRLLVDRLTTKAYADLQNLVEIMPGMTDTERKRQMLDYVVQTRQTFIRLLVLVQWSKCARDIQRCQDVIGHLQQLSNQFGGTVHTLWQLHQSFHRAKLRNYDLATAADVLGSGSYRRLPTIMKNAFIPPTLPNSVEKARTTERLNDLMRMRLFCDEQPPAAMHSYTIDQGLARFHVEGEFEISLTLDGAELSKPWRVVDAACLVQVDSACCREVNMSLAGYQQSHLVAAAQQQLLPRPAGAMAATSVDTVPTRPLIRLYQFMHNFSLVMQMEILFTQAVYLSRTRWEDHLSCTISSAHTSMRIYYWCRKPSYAKQPIQSATSARTTNDPAIYYIDIVLNGGEEHDRAKASSSRSEESESRVGIQLRCNTPDIDAAKLKITSTAVNVEQVIFAAVHQHARIIADELRGYLLLPSDQPDALLPDHIGALEMGESDDQQATQDRVEATDSGITNAYHPAPTIGFAVQYQPGRVLSVNVDVRTGRIVLQHKGQVGHLIYAKLKETEVFANRNPSQLHSLLLAFKRELVLMDIESLARRLGLCPVRQLAIRTQDWRRLGDDIQCISFLPILPNAYITVGIRKGHLHFWLMATGSRDEHCTSTIVFLTTIKPSAIVSITQPSSGILHSRVTADIRLSLATLALLLNYCRERIRYLAIERKLKEHGIDYRWWSASSVTNSSDECSHTTTIRIRPYDIPTPLHLQTVLDSFSDIDVVLPKESSQAVQFACTVQSGDFASLHASDDATIKYQDGKLVIQSERMSIDALLTGWHQALYMAYLARQLVSQRWRTYHQVHVHRFNFSILDLSVGKIRCKLTWLPEEGQSPRGNYQLELSNTSTRLAQAPWQTHLQKHGNLRATIEMLHGMSCILDAVEQIAQKDKSLFISLSEPNSLRIVARHWQSPTRQYGVRVLLLPGHVVRIVDLAAHYVAMRSAPTTPVSTPSDAAAEQTWSALLPSAAAWQPITALAEEKQLIEWTKESSRGELVLLPDGLWCKGTAGVDVVRGLLHVLSALFDELPPASPES